MRLTAVELDRAGDGRVARLRIPGDRLDARSAAELATAATALVEEREIRVVVLSARSDHFCAGPADDLEVFALRPDPATALAGLRVPVVAALSGACRAEGLEIALAADIRVGAPDTVLALDHI